MRQFEYASPTTPAQAASLLGTAWGNVEILAGGTDLLVQFRAGLRRPTSFVDVKRIHVAGEPERKRNTTRRHGHLEPDFSTRLRLGFAGDRARR